MRTIETSVSSAEETQRVVQEHGVAVTSASSGRFFTISEVCGLLRVSRTTVWRIMNQQGLRVIRVGGMKRIRECDLEMWIERHSISHDCDN
jgi:excisionase family DNA binding protein